MYKIIIVLIWTDDGSTLTHMYYKIMLKSHFLYYEF